MAFTLYSLLQAALLCVNAIAVLHEERFLKNSEWGSGRAAGAEPRGRGPKSGSVRGQPKTGQTRGRALVSWSPSLGAGMRRVEPLCLTNFAFNNGVKMVQQSPLCAVPWRSGWGVIQR